MLSSKELSERWGIGQCLVRRLARQGRIPGAKLCGRTWTFPENAQKPADARVRTARTAELSDPDAFRCACYEFRNEDSFDPPLNAEERTMKLAFEAFYACRYEEADRLLGDMPETSANRYLRIGSLYCGCMADIMLCNTGRFLSRYSRLCAELYGDFPHKAEMMEYLHSLRSVLGADDYYREEFAIDPGYPYDKSFLPKIANLSAFPFTLAGGAISDSDLRASELNCMLLEGSGAYADLESTHVNLGIAYGILQENGKRDFHLRKALALAKAHEIYFPVAMQIYYSRKMFDQTLGEMPRDFADFLIRLSDDSHRRFSRFMGELSEESVYVLLRPDDIAFLQYAMQGLTNKEVAALLGISTGNVGKRYGSIYAALGVSKKSEMLERYNASLERIPLSDGAHAPTV